MQKSMRAKLAEFDAAKAIRDRIMAKGEVAMKRNGEQAEAYFMVAIAMETDLMSKLGDMYRLRDLLTKVAKRKH
jgi:hypothetical protein